jgi:hypothetical protein
MGSGHPASGRPRTRLAAPDATFAELGIKGLDAGLWMGIVAPKATPQPVLDTLRQALAKVMEMPATKEGLLGAAPLTPTPRPSTSASRPTVAPGTRC